VICVSTVAGSAPGSVVVTIAAGWVMLGTIEMLSVKYAYSPNTASAIAINPTASGFRSENSVSFTQLSTL
jgi:hypothetical protein